MYSIVTNFLPCQSLMYSFKIYFAKSTVTTRLGFGLYFDTADLRPLLSQAVGYPQKTPR
jgi:hypothetical protein